MWPVYSLIDICTVRCENEKIPAEILFCNFPCSLGWFVSLDETNSWVRFILVWRISMGRSGHFSVSIWCQRAHVGTLVDPFMASCHSILYCQVCEDKKYLQTDTWHYMTCISPVGRSAGGSCHFWSYDVETVHPCSAGACGANHLIGLSIRLRF